MYESGWETTLAKAVPAENIKTSKINKKRSFHKDSFQRVNRYELVLLAVHLLLN